MARNRWEEVGGLAPTPSTRHRPGTCEQVAEDVVTLYGQPSRAVVVPSSRQEQRRQKRRVRALQASSPPLETAGPEAARLEDACRADAEAAAAKVRA